jgi:hypothetical protein
MHKLVYFLPFLFLISCAQEELEKTDSKNVSNVDFRIWQQSDTLINLEDEPFDSVRQIKLKVDNPEGLYLEAQADASIYLFYKDKLLEKSDKGYLKYSFSKSMSEEFFLNLDEKVTELSYGLYSIKNSSSETDYQMLRLSPRNSKWISDNILILLLIGASLLMVVIKINFDKRYSNILSINNIFTFRLKEGDQSRIRIMDRDNLVFAGLYVFLTAALIYFLILGKEIRFLGIEADGILSFLKIFLFITIGLIGKLLLVVIASNLFGNTRIPAYYIKEMLNINLFFIVLLFFSSILIFLLHATIPAFWLTIAIYGLLVLYLVRLIFLYFKILKLSSFSNLYLFSYFCTTEIFPFLIGLKYFI